MASTKTTLNTKILTTNIFASHQEHQNHPAQQITTQINQRMDLNPNNINYNTNVLNMNNLNDQLTNNQPPSHVNHPITNLAPQTRHKNILSAIHRTQRNINLPENACAYVAAVDAMIGNNSFKRLTIGETEEPDITLALKRNIPTAEMQNRLQNYINRLTKAAPALIGTTLRNI
jgi:hypothetical protein